MPLLSLTTNVPLPTAQQDSLLAQLSQSTARMLGKPESYVMVKVEFASTMLFAGTSEPLAYLELKSIGLPEEMTADFSQALCKSVTDVLNIPPQRIYIEFANASRHMWGWDARTFA